MGHSFLRFPVERFAPGAILPAWQSNVSRVRAIRFVRIHTTLRCTPAMAAGVTTKLWELTDMVTVLEDWEARHMMLAA